ncbi:hypothetical protein M093_3061 [Bacteroides uniformis str. 3978 T3 i]|nr:hypothetical protein M093_3061 [Bacteroides uniformis str. 3978 T3 i]
MILLYHFPVLHVSEGKKHAGQTRVIGEKFLNLKRASGKNDRMVQLTKNVSN